MMCIQQTKGLARVCRVFSRSYGRSLGAYTSCQPSDLRKRATYNQVRLCSSENKKQGAVNSLKQLQMDLGGPVSSFPAFKGSVEQEQTFLNTELRSLGESWPELGRYLDGREVPIEKLVAFVEENLSKCSLTALCELIPSYLKVFKHETDQFKFVVEEGLRRMPDMSLNEAVFFVNTLFDSSSEKLEKKYFAMCEEILKGKFKVVTSPEKIIFAMSMMRKHDMTELNEMFESLLMKCVDKMGDKQMSEVLFSRAVEKQRNPRLVQPLVRKLCESDFSQFSVSEMSKLFYSCSMLHIQNVTLLQNMSKYTLELLSKNGQPNRGEVKSILKSCELLGWRDNDLLKQINHWIEEDTDSARSAERIISLCHLGYSGLEQCVKEHSRTLNKSQKDILKQSKPLLWLKLVHAKATQGLVSVKEINEALNPDFYSPLVNNIGDQVKIMLLNLQGCLEIDLKMKDSPPFDAKEWADSIKVRRGKSSLSHTVEETLKHVTSDVKGPFLDEYGHIIDFEIMYSDQQDEHAGQLKKPVHIRVLEFKEMVTEPTGCKATGRSLMAIRHLQAKSTPIVIIPYYRWLSGIQSLQQAIQLESRIKTAIKVFNQDSKTVDSQSKKESI